MNSMLTMIGYELKKILKRKSTWIVFFGGAFLVFISCFAEVTGTVYVEGKPAYSHYEMFITDRAYAKALSGKDLDGKLISQMQEAYGKVPDVPLYTATEEYQTYARPYSAIYNLVRPISKNLLNEDKEPVNILTLDGDQYYEMRNQVIKETLEKENLSNTELKKHLELNEQLKTPIQFQYADGYNSLMSKVNTLGLILILIIAICLAPVFANEYMDRTDQLILTSRFGKCKAITAKLVAGISFGIIVSLLIILIQFIPTMILYGNDGWNAPIQLVNIFSTYPLTILEGVVVLYCMVMVCAIFTVCVTLYLSARLKSSFGVIVVICSFLMISIFLIVPDDYRLLYQLVKSLPINVMSEADVFSDYLYVFGNQCFTTYHIIPIIYGLISALLLFVSHNTFKNHQVI